ncbi:uncharacterized protein LOC124165350 [Ischnura elegans]|uniref:uncharacterized protein LOC124165350 n=1 Tax=Ischnura elegans TaxID=197161 RepID=UPI001ED8731A|nr:uncharacterized protein LOC124165350 [Ischnura elegans]
MDPSEQLIAEVHKRPSLWNLKGKAYYNRTTVDRDWKKVAEITGLSVGTAKVRWKNLRDHFRKELLKQPKMYENGQGEKVASRWIHFNSLLFLKNVLKPRRAKGKLTVVIERCPDSNPGGEAEYTTVDEDSVDGNASAADDKLPAQLLQAADLDATELPASKKKYKNEPGLSECDAADMSSPGLEAKFLKLESGERLSILQAQEDDDLNFLKSLIPYMKSLPPIRKLMIRSQFQNLLAQEMISCQSSPDVSQQSTSGFATPSTAGALMTPNQM